MTDCLFCKIIAGSIPSTKIYEDDNVLAFKDIDPQAPFHAVVIPKKHITGADMVSPENSDAIAKVFEAIAVIAKENDLSDGFRVVNNCGQAAGQTVHHIHFHLLARRDLGWPPG